MTDIGNRLVVYEDQTYKAAHIYGADGKALPNPFEFPGLEPDYGCDVVHTRSIRVEGEPMVSFETGCQPCKPLQPKDTAHD